MFGPTLQAARAAHDPAAASQPAPGGRDWRASVRGLGGYGQQVQALAPAAAAPVQAYGGGAGAKAATPAAGGGAAGASADGDAVYEEAEREFVAGLFNEGAAAYAKGDYATAHDKFMQADKHRSSPALWFSAAQALRMQGGRDAEAVALYQRYLASGDSKRAAEAKGWVDKLSAATDTETYKAGQRDVTRQLFDEGAADYDKGDYEAAYRKFMAADRHLSSPALWFSAAQALRSLGGRDAEAVALYQRYLASGEGKRAAEAQGWVDKLSAATDTETYKAGQRDIGSQLFNEGAADYDKGDYEAAYNKFMAADRHIPSPALWFSAAQALRKLGGRDAEAVALYQRYLASGHGKRAAEAQQWIDKLQPAAVKGRSAGSGPPR